MKEVDGGCPRTRAQKADTACRGGRMVATSGWRPGDRMSEGGRRIVLQGEAPSPANPPPGCRFHTRCPHAEARCREEVPKLRTVGDQHRVACHLVE